jgi:stage II sporulation protein D
LKGLQKVIDAVEGTASEVLYFDDKLICATYFASSGGLTEDASEVWNKIYPYLQSVESPGEEDCGYFSEQVTFTSAQMQDALGVKLSGRSESLFGMVRHTVGGGVDLMRVG